LVVRRDGDGIKRYVHLGTGNYHTKTTKLYTDYGLMTCEKSMGQDVHKIFQELTGMGKAARLKQLKHSPFTLHPSVIEWIEFETEQALAGKPARIIAKFNSLTEENIMQALYRASQAGVEIDLIVRGICCLKPGIPGLSENIRVRSIIGRFLEHTRIYHFHHGGDDLVYCSSADWMDRNLFNRVETCFPVNDPVLKAQILEQGLHIYLRDNTRAWELQSDGRYQRAQPQEGEASFIAQQSLLDTLGG
jgi:polyphosphate kinase